jgi:hypothetical protein
VSFSIYAYAGREAVRENDSLRAALVQAQAAQAAAVAAEREACIAILQRDWWKGAPVVAATIRARAALPSAGAGDGWLPIETAPRDGTWFWGYAPTRNSSVAQQAFRWRERQGWEAAACHSVGGDPTHWRPLPASPAQPPADAPPDGDEGARR